MSLAALAASATMYDHIDDVAADTGFSAAVAQSTIVQYGIASVDGDGNVSMSERQSLTAARALDNAEHMR